MKIFLIVLLILVFVPFIIILLGAFLPSKVLTSYEQALGKLPHTKREDEIIEVEEDVETK